MVTAVSKNMNRDPSIKTTTTTIIAAKKLESIGGSISSAAGFRLLIEANGGLGNIAASALEMCETMSSISKNSIYKQRIDAMFDDSRWVRQLWKCVINCERKKNFIAGINPFRRRPFFQILRLKRLKLNFSVIVEMIFNLG